MASPRAAGAPSGSTRRRGGGSGSGSNGGAAAADAADAAAAARRRRQPLPLAAAAALDRARGSPCVRGLVLWVALSLVIVHALAAVRWLTHPGAGGSASPSQADEDGGAGLRRVDELRSSVEGLRRQADGRDGLLARIRRERSDAGAASDRLALIRDQLTKESIAAFVGDEGQRGDRDDSDGATGGWERLGLPRVGDLLAEIVGKPGGDERGRGREREQGPVPAIRGVDTPRLRQLFFQARRELKLLHPHQHPHQGRLNWTRLSALLSSGELPASLDWRDRMLPDCGARERAVRSLLEQRRHPGASSSSSSSSPPGVLTLEELVDANEEVRAAVEWIGGELVPDRVADAGRRWSVALESTSDGVQERADAIAAGARPRALLALRDLQERLDRLEARLAQRDPGAAQGGRGKEAPAPDCVQPSQVLQWIDAALDAHYRQRDVREALAAAVRQDDRLRGNATAVAAELLSAARLPPGFEAGSSYGGGGAGGLSPPPPLRFPALWQGRGRRLPHQPGLRLWLDTPLTHQAALWIDALVEAAEGRSDAFDAWVDAVQARATKSRRRARDEEGASEGAPSPREASIGRYAVRSLLELAGRLDDCRLAAGRP